MASAITDAHRAPERGIQDGHNATLGLARAAQERTRPHATMLTITADPGGYDNPHTRLSQRAFQRPIDQIGLRIEVRHFPPDTTDCNAIKKHIFGFVILI